MAADALSILTYPYPPPAPTLREWDPRSARAAARLIGAIAALVPEASIEHIGSTAIPCAGKGYIDLLIVYPDGALEHAKEALAQLGFQRQKSRDPFPEDRPMRVGVLEQEGALFPIHAHVVASTSPEAADLVAFRDRLRTDAELREAYVARKRQILASGVLDGVDYAIAKGGFIVDVLSTDP